MRAWSEHKYGSAFVDGANLGAQLATLLKPQESLFVFGVYPDIYTYAGKPPRRGAINLWLGRADYGYSLSPRLPGRVLTPLKKTPLDRAILDQYTLELATPADPIRRWLQANCHVTGTQFGMRVAVPRTHAPSIVAPSENPP